MQVLLLSPDAAAATMFAAACCPLPAADNEAHLALLKDNAFQVQTKPHGHGDVHMLLHSTGE